MQHHIVCGKTPTQGHVKVPEGTYEEEHGREGFFGPVSHLYHTQIPTGWTRIEGPLKPRCFDCNQIDGGKANDTIGNKTTVLYNSDVRVQISKPTTSMDYTFRNGDGDELYFVHRGQGTFLSDYGPLNFVQGDYIVIPRGTTYRIELQGEQKAFFLITESKGTYTQPERGMLGQHALYDPAVIGTPKPWSEKQLKEMNKNQSEYEVKIQREGQLTSVWYPFDPLDVVGWKGNLYPWKLSVHDICPVMSHRAHLPPSVHTTFVNKNFVVCSFVPRPTESAEGAERVPFFHRNIDYDEVLFYHAGNFFSRDGVGEGAITFHPQGIHHGPHPKALKKQWDLTETDEIAVMIDTRYPLTMTPEAHSAEWQDYYLSWAGQLADS